MEKQKRPLCHVERSRDIWHTWQSYAFETGFLHFVRLGADFG